MYFRVKIMVEWRKNDYGLHDYLGCSVQLMSLCFQSGSVFLIHHTNDMSTISYRVDPSCSGYRRDLCVYMHTFMLYTAMCTVCLSVCMYCWTSVYFIHYIYGHFCPKQLTNVITNHAGVRAPYPNQESVPFKQINIYYSLLQFKCCRSVVWRWAACSGGRACSDDLSCLHVLVPEDNSHSCLDVYVSPLPVGRVLSCTQGKTQQILTCSLAYCITAFDHNCPHLSPLSSTSTGVLSPWCTWRANVSLTLCSLSDYR